MRCDWKAQLFMSMVLAASVFTTTLASAHGGGGGGGFGGFHGSGLSRGAASPRFMQQPGLATNPYNSSSNFASRFTPNGSTNAGLRTSNASSLPGKAVAGPLPTYGSAWSQGSATAGRGGNVDAKLSQNFSGTIAGTASNDHPGFGKAVPTNLPATNALASKDLWTGLNKTVPGATGPSQNKLFAGKNIVSKTQLGSGGSAGNGSNPGGSNNGGAGAGGSGTGSGNGGAGKNGSGNGNNGQNNQNGGFGGAAFALLSLLSNFGGGGFGGGDFADGGSDAGGFAAGGASGPADAGAGFTAPAAFADNGTPAGGANGALPAGYNAPASPAPPSPGPMLASNDASSTAAAIDLQLADARLVSSGDATTGPTYRVWVKNNSTIAVSQAIQVGVAAAASQQPTENDARALATIAGLAAGETGSVDVTLPASVTVTLASIGGDSTPGKYLLAAVDPLNQISEVNKANNFGMVERNKVPMLETAPPQINGTSASTVAGR